MQMCDAAFEPGAGGKGGRRAGGITEGLGGQKGRLHQVVRPGDALPNMKLRHV